MPMLRLHRAPTVLFLSAVAGGGACAPQPAEAPAPAATYPQSDGYAEHPEDSSAPMPAPRPGQYPAAPGGLPWPNFAEPPAADVPGLISQLDRAEQAVGLALMLTTAADADPSPNKGYPPPTATAGPPGTRDSRADSCSIACAALASMKRSAEHICSLVGEKGAACSDARARAQRADQRVLAACPACAAGK